MMLIGLSKQRKIYEKGFLWTDATVMPVNMKEKG